MDHKEKYTEDGYSLVELMVAIAIFVTVVTTSTAIIINTLREHSRAAEQRKIYDQARILLDTIYYDLTNARFDYFGSYQDCLADPSTTSYPLPQVYGQISGSDNNIVFVDASGVCNAYVLDVDNRIKKIENAFTPTPTITELTGPTLDVSLLRFRIFQDGLDREHAFVQIQIALDSLNVDAIPTARLQRSINYPILSIFNRCSIGIGDQSAVCPFREEDLPAGSVVVNFLEEGLACNTTETDSCIHGKQGGVIPNTSDTIVTNIQPGTYRVLAVGHDDHIQSLKPTVVNATIQPFEQFHMYLRNPSTGFDLKTGATDDIPDEVDCSFTELPEITVPSGEVITEVTACHDAVTWSPTTECSNAASTASSAQSLRVVCAAFIPSP